MRGRSAGAQAAGRYRGSRAPSGSAAERQPLQRALAELDLELGLAKVSTLGAEVVDSFYVRTGARAKVVDRDHQRELQRAVLHALSAS